MLRSTHENTRLWDDPSYDVEIFPFKVGELVLFIGWDAFNGLTPSNVALVLARNVLGYVAASRFESVGLS